MSPEWVGPVLALAGTALVVVGGIVGYLITAKTTTRASKAAATAVATAAATQAAAVAAVSEKTDAQALIDQLQEELGRYRQQTDKRLDKLEQENTAYRKYVFALIDHSNAHGITPLPWPHDLPR